MKTSYQVWSTATPLEIVDHPAIRCLFCVGHGIPSISDTQRPNRKFPALTKQSLFCQQNYWLGTQDRIPVMDRIDRASKALTLDLRTSSTVFLQDASV